MLTPPLPLLGSIIELLFSLIGKAEDDGALHQVCVGISDLITEVGYTKALSLLKMSDKFSEAGLK